MKDLSSPRKFRTDRPDRYLSVEVNGFDAPFWFRLPNERRQFQLLRFVGKYVRGGGRSAIQIVDALDVLSAVIGVCWYHKDFALSLDKPWPAADLSAERALVGFKWNGVYSVPALDPYEDETDEEFEVRCREREGEAKVSAREAAEASLERSARASVLRSYGGDVLDDLDDEDMGDRETVAILFGEVIKAISANFVEQKQVEDVLGNSRPPRDGVGSSA